MVDENAIETKLQEISDAIDAGGPFHYLDALKDALEWVLGNAGTDLDIGDGDYD